MTFIRRTEPIYISKDDFLKLHIDKKMTLQEIAVQLDVNPDHLSVFVRTTHNIKIIRHPKELSVLEISAIIELYKEIKCIKDVAIQLNLNRKRVTAAIKEAGLDIKAIRGKHHSEQLKGRLRRTNDEYIAHCLTVNITPIEEYKGVEESILHQCNVCSYTWKAAPGNVIHSQSGCPPCAIIYVRDIRRMSPAVYKERLFEFCPNLEVLEDYVDYSTKILHRCKTCNFEWKTRPICKKTLSGCRKCVTPTGTSGVFGIHTIVDDITFDSKLEAACYEELRKIFGSDNITHKKWYPNEHYCSDFYIEFLDLWIEVSNFNTVEYLEKIYIKRRLVNNFVFFVTPLQIIEYFK